jgi:hypothetical protein
VRQIRSNRALESLCPAIDVFLVTLFQLSAVMSQYEIRFELDI